MLHLLGRGLSRKVAPEEGLLGGPTVDMQLLVHPAPDLVPKRGLEVGIGKEPIILPVPCLAVRSQTPTLPDLVPDRTLHPRKG